MVDTSAFVDQAKLNPFLADVEAAEAGYRAAIARDIYQLGVAKKLHDEMERHYIPHMNFEAIEARRQETLHRILGLINEWQSR